MAGGLTSLTSLCYKIEALSSKGMAAGIVGLNTTTATTKAAVDI